MGESFFTTANQISPTEVDADSPITETLKAKYRARDQELADAVNPFGSNGDEGPLTINANQNLYGVKRYSNLTISDNVVVTVPAGKVLILYVKGTLTFGANAIISADYAGAAGSAYPSLAVNAIGGGGGGSSQAPYRTGGSTTYCGEVANGGTFGGAGANTPWTRLFGPMFPDFGIPIGGASGSNVEIGNIYGGSGGGYIFIECPNIVYGSGATIRARGQDKAEGGAGGGGVIHIRTRTVTGTPTLQVAGGTGSVGSGNGGNGIAYVELML